MDAKDMHIYCPLCEESKMEYKRHNDTHAWICEECPSILLEFYNNNDYKNLKEIIK